MADLMTLRRAAAVLAVAAVTLVPGLAAAQSTDKAEAGTVVTIAGDGGDIRAGGAVVTIRGEADTVRAGAARLDVRVRTTDSAWIGGAHVTVDGTIGRDLRAFGANVTSRATVEGDATIIGGVVVIDGPVQGDLDAGGANLAIGRGASIGGSLKAGGASVSVMSDIAGDVDLGGASVDFGGTAGGNVVIAGENITVSGLARIDGDLTVYSRNEPIIAEGATIAGKIEHKAPDKEWFDVPDWLFGFLCAGFMAAGTILAGLVLILFGGRLLGASADTVRDKPISSLLIGILTVVLVPLVSAALGVTIIGLPVAFALLLLLPLLLVFGHATAAAGIAGGILSGAGVPLGVIRTFFFLVIGAVLIAAVGLIPWVGPWLVAVAIATGLGAFARTFFGRLRRRPDRPVHDDAPAAAAVAPAAAAGPASAEPPPEVPNAASLPAPEEGEEDEDERKPPATQG